MKKPFLLASLLLFAACATPQGEPPEDVGQFPPDYITQLEGSPVPTASPEASPTDIDASPTASPDIFASPDASPGEAVTDVVALRELNTELALQVESLERKLAIAQEELAETEQDTAGGTGVAGLDESHLELMAAAIVESEQPEYPFRNCGQMGTLLREGWFSGFADSLNDAQIRFANGFLETGDLFGGCYSAEGNTAFFLGAERGETLRFVLLKYETDTGDLTPALLLDGAESAVVTEFGSREGPYVNFPADDGRTFRYYYDANIVVQAP